MNARVAAKQFFGLKMRWRVLIVLLAIGAVGAIAGGISDAAQRSRPGYVDGYDFGQDFFDARRLGETGPDYCRRLTWEAGPIALGVEYVKDFHVGCEAAIDAG